MNNITVQVMYLTDDGRQMFNKRTLGQWKGFRYNGSLKDYFIKYFKDNIDQYALEEDEETFWIRVKDVKLNGVTQRVLYKRFVKTLKGFAKAFSNEHLKILVYAK